MRKTIFLYGSCPLKFFLEIGVSIFRFSCKAEICLTFHKVHESYDLEHIYAIQDYLLDMGFLQILPYQYHQELGICYWDAKKSVCVHEADRASEILWYT